MDLVFGVLCLGLGILEFRILFMGFQAWDMEFGILGLEFFDWEFGFGILSLDLELGIWGLEFWILGYSVSGFMYGI